MANEDWAIVVGIRYYPEQALGDLNGPENDANAFYDWVTSPTGGAVPQAQTALILSSQHDPPFLTASTAEPTPQRVQRAFDDLQDLSEQNSRVGQGSRVGRRLYIYMAGHGFAPQPGDTALLTANATAKRLGYHILGKLEADFFLIANYFDEVVLFMDCCRNILPQSPRILPPYLTVIGPDALDKARLFYGFGTKWSRVSRERMMPDGLWHGVFTTALLAGLNGAATDPNGQITATSLGDYLYSNMKDFLSPEDLADPVVPKEPDVDYDKNPLNPFILATVPVPDFPVTIHLPASTQGKTVEILSGQGLALVRSGISVPPAWQVRLRRGLYLAQVLAAGLQVSFEVNGAGDVDVQL
jgi:Caspase domain